MKKIIIRMRQGIFTGALASLLVLSAGCGRLVYADGPYHGRVIDAETKQPIEGAAVLAVWWKETAMIGHPMQSVHDAQETLTDKDGNFTIPGTWTLSLNPLSRIDEPRFTIFKPAYKAYNGPLKPITLQGIPQTVPRPYEKDGRTVWELQLLRTKEERLENLTRLFVPSHVPEEKYPNLIRLKDLERVGLGLKPLREKKGERQ